MRRRLHEFDTGTRFDTDIIYFNVHAQDAAGLAGLEKSIAVLDGSLATLQVSRTWAGGATPKKGGGSETQGALCKLISNKASEWSCMSAWL